MAIPAPINGNWAYPTPLVSATAPKVAPPAMPKLKIDEINVEASSGAAAAPLRTLACKI